MDDLSPELKALYELLKAEMLEEYGRCFTAYKKEMLDIIHPFAADTSKQIKAVTNSVATIQSVVSTDFVAVKEQIGEELESVRHSLATEISQLAATLERSSSMSHGVAAKVDPAGPDGHRTDNTHRGTTCAGHMSSPVGGTNPGCNPSNFPHSSVGRMNNTDGGHGPRVDLPQFYGTNPKLWQRRCEDYFQRWNTPSAQWAAIASDHFIGAAVTWLESY